MFGFLQLCMWCECACFVNVRLVNVVTHCCDVRNPARHPNRSGAVLPNPRRRAGLALPALPEHPNVLNPDPAPDPRPGLALVAIQIAATAALGLTPTGRSLVLAPTALTTDADGARVHRPCLTAADTLAVGAHTAKTPKKTRTVMVTPGQWSGLMAWSWMEGASGWIIPSPNVHTPPHQASTWVGPHIMEVGAAAVVVVVAAAGDETRITIVATTDTTVMTSMTTDTGGALRHLITAGTGLAQDLAHTAQDDTKKILKSYLAWSYTFIKTCKLTVLEKDCYKCLNL
ncbi:uncharacterized protein LOC107656658 isoform X5 [Sinocyclocheilus anshuiensis]|uniref:uncharacterized protein LOC107656658 isoform X5 n=1 Tax=Sinocyclocheilus anshuiensis TaxID=1608454 RepID=UPI0007BA6FB0|nr:PREDICTED: uncharacterized protein LOC107656658 isoform X5 [Sinocyclocheilus anshuiensis]